MAEELAPCVLWIDEIEKGFSSRLVSGGAERGNVARAFATFLTWLQEKKSPVYMIATANSISDMPAELVRKGRFDDIFFVDLPRETERAEIFRIHLKKRRRDPGDFDLAQMAKASEGFSGSEIEQAVIAAMYDAFTGDREFETKDVVRALRETVPLSETLEEQIKELRDWAKTRARPASLDTKLMDLLDSGKKKS
jgi:SpoVK/Ycf46/Vps4 family AAA+-type ATPase